MDACYPRKPQRRVCVAIMRKQHIVIAWRWIMCYTLDVGDHRARRLPSFSEGRTLQTKERGALPMYVTYSDLIQIGIFIVALVSLIYQIFRGRK